MESASVKGLLLPLDSKVGRNTQKEWLPYIQKLGVIQNTQYGIPFAGDALVMVYRPQQSPYPPTTWQELTTQTLPVFFPAADPEAVVVTTLYQTAGGNLYPENDSPLLDEAITQKTFALINNGTQSGAFPIWLSGYTTFDDSWQAFLEQHSGYAFVWASQFLTDSQSDDALTVLPAVSSNQLTRADGWVWSIPEMNTQSQEIAIALAEYLSDPGFVNQLDQLAGYLPVYTSGLDLIEDPDLKENVTTLTSTAQIISTSSTINTISPVFENAVIQIIKKQLYYQQAVDQTLSQVNK
jgi:ABC-type glycerol-3-phosphate transport system substrate-binding protein